MGYRKSNYIPGKELLCGCGDYRTRLSSDVRPIARVGINVARSSSWRDFAAKAIADVIEKVGTADEKTLRKAISDAYPFGERVYRPYDVWREEAKRQLNQLGFLTNRQKALAASYKKRGDLS